MRNRTRLGLVAVFGATALLAACGDDESPSGGTTAGTGGTSGGSGGSAAGSTSGGSSSGTFGAGTGGTAAGSGGTTAGSGGTTAGSGGATAGSGGTTAGTAGTGGVPHVIVPTVFIVDNVRLQLKGPDSGSGGEGGVGGEASGGAAGEASVAGAGGLDAGGAGAGAGGATEGGAGPGPSPAFLLTFDAAVAPLVKNTLGFSPNVGGTAGPAIFDQTTLTFEAAAGKPGGAAKMSVPFSVANQQADFYVPFAAPTDLTGYEIVADVKVTSFGDAGTCPSVWIYVWGSGYGNDATGEPSMGVTQQLVKDEWTTVRLNLDGPYGYHSVTNHANFKPTAVIQWGMQMNTFGCP